jgi:hypothetical protein
VVTFVRRKLAVRVEWLVTWYGPLLSDLPWSLTVKVGCRSTHTWRSVSDSSFVPFVSPTAMTLLLPLVRQLGEDTCASGASDAWAGVAVLKSRSATTVEVNAASSAGTNR